MNPKVSIIIPVYNGTNYMRDAIDSALQQTYNNCEVIVVNDGSTDQGATDAVAKSYGNRIRYYAKENGGVATAVNYGIQKMQGEYFAWLSHDDMFTPDKIEKQIKAIQKSGMQHAIVHSNFDFLYVEKNETVSVDFLQQYTKEQMEDSCFTPIFLAIHGSTVLIHKSHFERVGLYDTTLRATQDSEFLFRVMRGQKSIFIPESLMISRIHAEQGQQTMACHVSEYNDMFIHFCSELTDEEKIHFCGSVWNFYYRLYLLLKHSRPANRILEYLREQLEIHKKPECSKDLGLKELKMKWAEQGIKKLYIFGAGQMGKEMLQTLKSYGFSVDGWVDNAKEKQGAIIEGLPCISPTQIQSQEQCLFLVAMMDAKAVIQQLQNMKISHIMTIGDCNRLLFRAIPSYIVL